MLRFLFPQKHPLSDEELLQRYQQSGRMDWLVELYGRYAELVYGLSLKYLKGEQQAEDAVMSVFEQLVEKARKHEIQHFRSWLYVLAKNHCLMQLRRAGQQREQSTAPDLMQSADTRHLTIEWPEEALEKKALQDCLPTLPEQQRACIEAFYLQGYTYKEIAADRAEPVGKVRSHIQNGRRNLRICIEKKKTVE